MKKQMKLADIARMAGEYFDERWGKAFVKEDMFLPDADECLSGVVLPIVAREVVTDGRTRLSCRCPNCGKKWEEETTAWIRHECTDGVPAVIAFRKGQSYCPKTRAPQGFVKALDVNADAGYGIFAFSDGSVMYDPEEDRFFFPNARDVFVFSKRYGIRKVAYRNGRFALRPLSIGVDGLQSGNGYRATVRTLVYSPEKELLMAAEAWGRMTRREKAADRWIGERKQAVVLWPGDGLSYVRMEWEDCS